MKTYFRLLSFAKPFSSFVPQYIVFTLLGILFSLTQFTLFQPLFDVIFEQEISPEKLLSYEKEPVFALRVDYVSDFFNYHLYKFKRERGSIASLQFVCAIIVVSVFFSNLFRYLSLVIVAKIRAKMVFNLRTSIFEHMTQLHLGHFSDQNRGDIMSRMTNDLKEVEYTIVDSIKVLVRDPATMLVFLIFLFYMSVKLTLFSLIVLPIGAGLISVITKKLKRRAGANKKVESEIVEAVDEALVGVRVVKAFTAEGYVGKKFRQKSQSYAHTFVQMLKTNELSSPISQFLGVVLICGILLYGGSLVLGEGGDSALSASEFITYIILFTQILNPGKEISKTFSNIQRGLVSGERLFEIIDTAPAIVDKEDAKAIPSFESAIEFKDVSFSYGQEPVLKNISITIPKGKTIALVGASGGGKSTMVDLIPRFYDVSEGEILIDGINQKDYQVTSLRELMGVVTQESILFNDTVFNNIAFGIKDAKMEDVIQAAKIANAHDFIMEMEEGYESNVGDRGSKLSGGQRQRVCIARAVMKNPSILILDEATSALDSKSEKLVQEALFNLMKNRTSVVIAHRLSTIQHADEIIVLDNGQIIERGTHEALMQASGQYQKLNALQSS